MLTAGEFCNREVVIAFRDEPVAEVARLMRDQRVGSIVVVEERADGRVPIGLVTDRDIVVRLVATEPVLLSQTPVREILSEKLVTVREEEDLADVLARMRSHGIRRVPVVDRAGLLQGIIASDDLLSHLAEELSRLAGLAGASARQRATLLTPSNTARASAQGVRS